MSENTEVERDAEDQIGEQTPALRRARLSVLVCEETGLLRPDLNAKELGVLYAAHGIACKCGQIATDEVCNQGIETAAAIKKLLDLFGTI